MILRGRRVSTYLFCLVLLVSAPLIVFTASIVWRIRDTESARNTAELMERANDAGRRFDRSFDRLGVGVRTLAGSSALARQDIPAMEAEMRRFSVWFDNIPLILIGADRSVVISVAGHAAIAPPVPDVVAAIATSVTAADQSAVVDIARDGQQAGPAVAVVAAGEGAGPRYYVAAVLDFARLGALLGQTAQSPDHAPRLTVRNDRGAVIARSDDPAMPGTDPGSESRTGQPDGRDSPDTIRVSSVAPDSGFVVSATVPRDAFGVAIRTDLIGTLAMGLTLLAIGLTGAGLLARRMVNGLQAVGAGKLSASTGMQEVDALAARLRAVSTARDAAEATLRDSEARQRDLIGTLDLAAIMAREFDGTIRFWSRGCVALYGWTPEEALGRSSHELLRTQFPEPLSSIEQTLLTAGEWTGDLVHRRRDGSTIVAAAHKTLRRHDDGRPRMVAESLIDVTALREAQTKLRLLNEDLERRVSEEIIAREAAQLRASHADRLRALGQLAGGIAHDFNNVLQAIAGGAALIARRRDDPGSVERLVNLVSDAAMRGASITRRMLVLARQGDLRPEPVEPEGLLQGLREVFGLTLGPDVDVEVDVAFGLPRLMADRAQLETALVNLATNARDAMQGGGRLRLLAGWEVVADDGTLSHPGGLQPGSYIRLSVVDSGTGMSQGTLSRVGEPFFTTKEVGKGTGLGLSMVKGFAEQSGGGFTIHSRLGEGTRATIYLPAVSGGDGAPVPGSERRARVTGRILVVDDDQMVRGTIVEQLQELGHKVLEAACGTDALAILQAREAVDVMITDLTMPGMDGLTLIREAQGIRPSLPAILLTGFTGELAGFRDSGVFRTQYNLLRKPATSAVLNDQVNALLEKI